MYPEVQIHHVCYLFGMRTTLYLAFKVGSTLFRNSTGLVGDFLNPLARETTSLMLLSNMRRVNASTFNNDLWIGEIQQRRWRVVTNTPHGIKDGIREYA